MSQEARQIIRRKAKRLERARSKVINLRTDVNLLQNIGEDERKKILFAIDTFILPYLQNDDVEENEYNFDNRNS